MLTKIYLEGAMGKEFGREWELSVNSPGEAMQLIDANCPGFQKWVYGNLDKYSKYQVIAEYEDGTLEYLENHTYVMERKCASLRFIPIIEGAGGRGTTQFIIGAILFVVGYYTSWAGGTYLMQAGIAMMVGGVIQMLTPMPNLDKMSETSRKDKTSYFFDGPVNTSRQGVPVPLIYGRCLVGSQVISASVTIDQLT